MKDPRQHLRSGMFWLGSANLIAQVLDVVSLIAILAYLTEGDIGLATLSWSLAVVLEAFNGMGIGASLLQSPRIDRDELDSIFWYATLLSCLLCVLMALGAPWIADYYDSPQLTSMIIVSALKLPIVSAALVPLQLLNRSLRFKDIGVIQTSSTLLSSIVKIVLAASGMGAWALVIANTAHGAFTLVGALLRQPFLPRLYFSWTRLKKHAIFGYKVAASGILTQSYRNADFLIVGKVFGTGVLGLYRVAFDIAMTPALTVLTPVNRTAFPVFSRLQEDRAGLARAFTWMQQSLAYLAVPVAIFLTFAGRDILGLFHEGRWVPVAPVLAVLAWAAVPRCLGHVFPELFKAVARPGLAFQYAVLTLVVLVGGILAVVGLFGASYGLMPIALVWLVAYLLIVLVLLALTTRLVPLTVSEYFKAFQHPVQAGAACLVVAALLSWARSALPDSPWVVWPYLLVLAAGILGAVWIYLRAVLGLGLADLLGRRASRAAGEER